MDLRDKKVIVTGGGSGIGRCLTERLIDMGALVGVFDIDDSGLDELARKRNSVRCQYCDITDYTKVGVAVDAFYGEFGGIDVLVNNAGILYSAPLVSFSPEGIKKHDIVMWEKVISTDLSSVFYMTVSVVEKMILHRTRGVIANISSVCSSGNAGQSAYSAAKAGVNALTATWAKELGPLGIRVVGIAPGFTETESTRNVMNEEVLKGVVGKVPLRRLGKPDEIVNGIISVIKNDFFCGKVFELDGGLVI